MNWLNHFLFSISLLFIFLGKIASINEIIIFTIIFAIFIDLDILFKRYLLKEKSKDNRSWIQEPFGLIFIGIPIGLILSFLIKPISFFLVIIPYASHIFLDYISIHNVFPLSPFSRLKVRVGFIKPLHIYKMFDIRGKFNENHFLILNIILFVWSLLNFY